MDIFTIDIGGAFIKFTRLSGRSGRPLSGSVPFKMYRHPERLASVLASIAPRPVAGDVAVTMTGELADSFRTRAHGVRHIVNSCVDVFGAGVRVFARHGELFSAKRAVRNHEEVASANWGIPPLWIARRASDFLLVDIGSTTADITHVKGGRIANKGWTDVDRLIWGELVYTGYLRTPVQAVVQSFVLEGREILVSAETFAVTGDVHLLRGSIKPSLYTCDTPDGGPRTAAGAGTRLARTILSERKKVGDGRLLDMAEQVAKVQLGQIMKAASRAGLAVIAIGHGAFILDPAFRGRRLKRHPLATDPEIKRLDPTRALAFLMRDGLI